MSLMPTVATLAAPGAEVVRELPMSPYAFGGLALLSFLVLLGVLWTFRNTAAKYETPARVGHGTNGTQGESHGSPGEHDPGAHH